MLSVIIPTFNGSARIGHCLDALIHQDYPGDYEIIVVDDASTDNTPETVRDFIRDHRPAMPVNIVESTENRGPAHVRNHGVRIAEGEIVLFTDDDCIPEKNWLTEMSAPFTDISVSAVKGAYRSGQKELTARFVQLEYEYKYERLKQFRYVDTIDTYSAGFRTSVFLAEGGFDTTFPVACAEDFEFSYRLSLKGYKMVFNPSAIVRHHHPDTLLWYLGKKYKFAYWRWLAVRKNPEKLSSDTHTPADMKLLTLISPMLACGLIYSLFRRDTRPLKFLGGVFLAVSSGFSWFILRKDLSVGLLSPCYIFLRGISQFFGLLFGLKNLYKR